jgi:subtilisin family serine protease
MRRVVLTACLLVLALALVLPAQVSGQGTPIREPLSKFSPSLQTVTEGGKPVAATVTREIDGRTYLDVFLEGKASEADLEALGVIIGSRLPNGMMTAEIPFEALREVAALDGVTRITAAYMAHPCLDLSVPLTEADPAYWTSSPPNFTGQTGAGVIVGDVNSGIDYKHGDFKNPDGTTRILYIWDQIDTSTPRPPGFSYGREFTQANINANLPTVRDGADGHGTHCMGIAAGDGSATGNGQPADVFIGMAPRADMIVVVTDYSTAHIVDGVNYIFQRAAALGKNAVVNLSLGSSFGAHLGTESFDTSLNALTGAGKIIVASAGNEGGQSLHALQLVPIGGGNQTVTFSIPSYSANSGSGNDFLRIDAYYEGTANMTVSVTSPRGTSNSGSVTKGSYVQKITTSQTDGAIYVENGYTASPSGLTNIYVQIWDYAQTRYPRVGTWTVTLTPVSGPPTSPRLDLWIPSYQLGAAYAAPVFTSDVDEHVTVGSPAAAANLIAVGAITNKNVWDSIDGNTYMFVDTTAVGSLTSWSSVGPLRDGTQKPDIVSGGGGVMSTLSSAVPRNTSTNPYIHPDGQHWMMSGTSMAAPHVAGGVALILADTPNLTPAQVKAELYADALVDGQTGAVWNYQYGNGKLRMLRPDTQNPSVTVTSPNGGENWAMGSSHNITWTATDNVGVTTIDIDYSINGGVSWIPVATGEANDGAYAWTVPSTATAQALVRVKAYDGAGNSGVDASDAVFTIADQSDPDIAVVSPNGGETLATGSSQDITWTATDNIGVTTIDIDYSINGGVSWIPVATGEANDGAYAWTVPSTATAQALVRVKAYDGAGNSGVDASDAVFTIADQSDPDVAVVSPNGGETLATGSSQDITWTATDNIGVTAIDIEYSIDGGVSWNPVATGEANDGTYAWTVPSTATIQALVRVKAYDGAGNSGVDASDAVFTIADQSDPDVAVVSPNGGETLATGSSQDITWTATDNIGVTAIDIEYSIDGGVSWNPVATGEANDGTYAWTVPSTATIQALVRVKAYDGAGNSGVDASDAVFTIADETSPTMAVTAPNGGETLATGSSQDITWTATDNIGVTAIDIEYSIDGGVSWNPVATAPTAGPCPTHRRPMPSCA